MSSKRGMLAKAINSVIRKGIASLDGVSSGISKPHKKKRHSKKRKRLDSEDPVQYTMEHEFRLGACVNLLKNRVFVNLNLSAEVRAFLTEEKYEEVLLQPVNAYGNQNRTSLYRTYLFSLCFPTDTRTLFI